MPKTVPGVLDPDVVPGQAAGQPLPADSSSQRQVRADDLPALTTIARTVHVLRSHVDGVVVMGRDVDRRVPDEPVAHVARGTPCSAPARPRPAGTGAGPPRNGRRCRPPSRIQTPTTTRCSDRPDRAWPIRSLRHPRGATCHAESRSMRRWPMIRELLGPPVGRLVLLVAEHVVGDLVVDRHVVHLRVRETLPEPGVLPRLIEIDSPWSWATIMRSRVRRVDPHVVVITTRRLGGAAP